MNSALAAAGHGFLYGALASLLLLTGGRLAGWDPPLVAYAVLIGGGILVGVARTLADLPSTFDTALALDRMLRLRDRLATAYAIDGRSAIQSRAPIAAHHDEEFAALVREDGERLAETIDVRSLAPICFSMTWGGGAAAVALLVLGILYMPVIAWGDQGGAKPLEPGTTAEFEEQRDHLHQSISEVVADLREDGLDDAAAREEIDALERLADQMSSSSDPERIRRARDESAARVNELAERFQEQARRDREAAQRLAERFAGLEDAPSRPMSAEEFDEALRRGDFGAAATAMERRLQQREQITESERRELAEHLRRRADQIDQLAQEDDADLSEREAQLEQMLRELGADEQTLRDLTNGDEAAQEEATQRLSEGFDDEEFAEKVRRDLEELREEQALREQLRRDLEAMRESMQEAAEELDSPQPDMPEPPPDEEPSRPDDARETAQPPENASQKRDVPDPAEDSQRLAPQQHSSDHEPSPLESGAGEDESPRAQDEPSASKDRTAETPEQQVPAGEQPVTSSQSDQGTSTQPDEEPPSQHEPGAPDQRTRREEQTAAEEGDGPSQRLREIAQRQQAAERRQSASERLRQRARELAEPPDRDIDRELQRQLARNGAEGEAEGRESEGTRLRGDAKGQHDAEIEDVDARQNHSDPGEVIAEWFDDEMIESADPQVRRALIERRMHEARRVAERAVDEAAVPARYHDFIRRYFSRGAESSEGDGESE